MDNITFKSNNKILEVGKDKDFRLLEIEGIESGVHSIEVTENILDDGSRITNKRITSRLIALVIEYAGPNSGEGREKAIRFFNIKHQGIMSVGGKSIEYEVDGFNSKLVNRFNPFKCLVHLLCPNPFWQDETIKSEEMVTWEGGLTFPLTLPTSFATAGEKIMNIVNSGDVETPIVLEISGKATNPKIENTLTGEFIRVNRTLQTGDKLIITTEFGNKRVEQNGVNVFNYIDLDSTFFNLNVGDNVLKFTTEDVNDEANIKISYANRYIGV